MSDRPSVGVGKRIAEYRRLAGLSARELAEAAGAGLTRGVIANVESGRKSDLTVDQLAALAYVLGIPPVALAYPLDRPFGWVEVTAGRSLQVWQAAGLFGDAGSSIKRRTGATPTAVSRIRGVASFIEAQQARAYLRRQIRKDDEARQRYGARVDELDAEIRELADDLHLHGVDLTIYTEDGERNASQPYLEELGGDERAVDVPGLPE